MILFELDVNGQVFCTHVSYVNGNAQMGLLIELKHNYPLLPKQFLLVTCLKRLELDLKITATAHPMKRFEIRYD